MDANTPIRTVSVSYNAKLCAALGDSQWQQLCQAAKVWNKWHIGASKQVWFCKQVWPLLAQFLYVTFTLPQHSQGCWGANS